MTGGPAGSRLAAYRILQDVEDGSFADRSAAARLRGLDRRDRSLALELAYGCVRLRGRLDRELAHLVDRPLSRLERPVLLWLRLGLYQIRELRIPVHAAVDESVEGVRAAVGDRATGLVNGVLRTATRTDRVDLFPSFEGDPLGYLTTWGSHPEWLVRRWLERWPAATVRRLVELDNRPPPVTFRLLEGGVEEARSRLGPTGVEVEPLDDWPRCVRLTAGEPSEFLAAVPAVAQDPAASAVVDYVGDPPDGTVLDACAAPGGKALGMAARGPEPLLVAADRSAGRLGPAVEAARRTGLRLSPVCMDARRPAVREADLVLVDVPCTGTGTLRRRPDARWRVGPERLEAMVTLQGEILDAAADVVRPGGLLVYATCSLEAEENEDRVVDFLSRNEAFRSEAPATLDAGLPPDCVDEDGRLAVLPWTRGTDGAFAARLRRRPA